MAKLKPSKSKINTTTAADIDEAIEQNEVDSVEVTSSDESDTSDEATVQEDKQEEALVRISVFVPVSPAPTIGKVDFVRDLGIPELRQQVYENIPYNAALVLQDKRIATIL